MAARPESLGDPPSKSPERHTGWQLPTSITAFTAWMAFLAWLAFVA